MEDSEMKKTYINPETILTELELQQMIAATVPVGVEGNADDAESKFGFLGFDDSFDDTDDADDTSLPGFNVWED
jgi:hypothetical protein